MDHITDTINENKTIPVDIINKFQIWMYEKKLSYNTIVTYGQTIKQLLEKSSYNLSLITNDEVYKFLIGKGVVEQSAIKKFLKFIAIENHLKFNYLDFPSLAKKDVEVVEILTKNQMQLVKKDMIKVNVDPLYGYLVRFIHIAGLRISETFAAKVEDFNWDEWFEDRSKYGFLTVKNTKSKRDRKVPIPPDLMEEIGKMIEDRDGELISNAIVFDFKTEKCLRRIKRKAKKAGVGLDMDLSEKELKQFIEEFTWRRYIKSKRLYFERMFRKSCINVFGRPYHPHILRSTRATDLLNNDVDIISTRDFLGHKSVSTTERYLGSSLKKLTSSMEKAGI